MLHQLETKIDRLLGFGADDPYQWVYDIFNVYNFNSVTDACMLTVVREFFGSDQPLDGSDFIVTPESVEAARLTSNGKRSYEICCGHPFYGQVLFEDDSGTCYKVTNQTCGSLIIQLCKDFIDASQEKDTLILNLERLSAVHPVVERL